MVKKLNQNESSQVTVSSQFTKLKSVIKDSFKDFNEHLASVESHIE